MQDDFMNRIEAEYKAYLADLERLPRKAIIGRVGEISDMSEVYNYLKYGHPASDEIAYLAQAAYPLREVCGFYRSTPQDRTEQIETVIHNICDKDHFSDSAIEKYSPFEHQIRFHRKPSDLNELKSYKDGHESDVFKVERVVELTPEQFYFFSRNLIADSPVITENKDSMWHDGMYWHCLLVRSPGVSDSILVEFEGYDYARYCAYVPDERMLELKDVPVAQYGEPEKDRSHKSTERGR